MRTLLHKHALITGGGSGIGLAIARRLYQEGCSVTLLGRTESKLQRARESLLLSSSQSPPSSSSSSTSSSSSSPSTSRAYQPDTAKSSYDVNRYGTGTVVTYHPLDVSSAESWQDLLRSVPRVDILVNSAGITQRSPLMKTAVEDVDEIISTNLKGAVLGCKFVGRAMLRNRNKSTSPSSGTRGAEKVTEEVKEREEWVKKELREEEQRVQQVQEGVSERGVVVNVASLLAQKGVIGTSVYAAAKAGVVGLTTSLANEYGRSGIRVNAVLPGYIETDMTRDLKNPSILQQIPLGRFGTTEEVADAALFLIKNPYANSCVLNLDGGLSAV